MKFKSILTETFLDLPPKKGGLRLSTPDGKMIVCSDKKNEHGEYEVRLYVDGKKNDDATYFTDDWDDAVDTAKAMAKKTEAKEPPVDMNPKTNKDDGVNNPKCPGCGGRDVAKLSRSEFRCKDPGCETEFHYEV